MRDCTALVNRAEEHVATINFNEACGLWQIVVVRGLESSMGKSETSQISGQAERVGRC